MRLALLILILPCWIFFPIQGVNAQNRSVSGTVTSSAGEPVQGVTVSLRGATAKATTDDAGSYRIDLPVAGQSLTFSAVGFETQELAIPTSNVLNVVLDEAQTNLDEVVVVGYGTQSRRTVTSAITKVGGEVLQDIPISTVGEGLKGKVAGARVYSSNNTPGADAVFRIRGGSSINKSNDPLVLVDGVERAFSGINPNDVESIEVLKDAASTAIYGSRASNGVVLITTKKGSAASSPRITFDVDLAHQSPETLIDFMDARDYINTVRPAVALSPNAQYNSASGYSASSGNDENSLYSTRYLRDGESVPAGYGSMPDPLDPSRTLIYQDNDYQSLMYRNVLWQNYYLGVDGGNEFIRYAASGGFTDDGGVALGTGYSRYSGRAKADVKISERLSLNTAFDFSSTRSSEFENQMNVIARGLATPATQKVYYADGRPTPGYNASSPNPVWWDYTRDIANKDKRLSLIGGLDYRILDQLKANVQISNYNHVTQYDYFEKAHEFSGLRTTKASFGELDRTKLDAYLSYDQSFGSAHSVSGMAGYSYQVTDNKAFSASATGASSDKVPTLTAGPNKTGADSKFEKEVLIGYFGRLSYDYQKKYLLMATFRYDGSSLFAEENRWGFFPGISGGWVVSEENFMRNSAVVNYLKVRASYGQTGNNSIGLYDALGRYATDARYNSNAGIVPATMPNRDLTWETSTQLDAGFDFSIVNNRISVSADYFNKITEDLLFSMELPNTTGFSNVQTNIGKVKFHGYDLELSSRNITGGDFSWDSKLTWSFVKNKVLELPDNGRDRNRIGGITLADGTAFGGTAEGEPLYRYYGYTVDHILQNAEQAANARYDESARGWDPADGQSIRGRKVAGDYEWMDRDGDGRVTSRDQFELGVTVPHTTGGLNNAFSYKNFSLNIFVDWALGHSINHNAYMRYFMNTFANNYTLVDEVKKAWTGEGDDTKYARFTANDPDVGNSNFSRTSDVFNYKGDYLCIREVTLQYRVPEKFIGRLGLKDLALTVSGNNLHYFSAVQGMGISPEVGASTTYNASYYNYPPIRRFSFGAKITL
ncbi:SusC/RagA family TonB-linked outer membrane protein [Parapedobacter pyrenivorans]|uniref:SusC/RagA family TonB-linked outer membrane protein n=1 Tax=Parapedobacter pyrenivorans TaxID=1305674 RepID=UPI00166CAA96|nr:TonB-dependent receptor [Parapedobacter pyrenivorans]